MSSHKAKVENRWFLRAMMRNPVTSGIRSQRAPKDRFLVRVQAEEPPYKILLVNNLQNQPIRSIELPQRKSLI
jgi:hypothetical protein